MKHRYFQRFLVLMAAVFTVALSGCGGDPVRPSTTRDRAQDVAEYKIGPADVLQITVWKNEMLTRTVPVRPDGMISMPLINEVRAAGLTPMQLRDTLASRLAAYLSNAEISVVVLEMNSYVVSVLGEVKFAGRYEFTSRVTVLDVLAKAGGVTEFASTSDIFLLRPEGGVMTRIPFNYKKVISARQHPNIFVLPGDIVIVP
jgi:polysaccharide export outer membrane protein